MADDSDDVGAKSPGSDPLASRLSLDPTQAEEGREYLRHQNEIAILQIESLKKLDKYETSHLRWRRFNDQMRGFLEVWVVFVGALVVIAVIAAIWSAAHDDGLIIDVFKVPSDLAAKGLTGDVVASQLLDQLTRIQADTDSSRAASTYSSNWGNDIKVQIPNTGISISEAYRYLAGWLGHQTHISGEIFRTDKGYALTVRITGAAGVRFTGEENRLDSLVAHAAENVYSQTQPFRYAVYLAGHGRSAEDEKVLSRLALSGPASDRPWAYTTWAYSAQNVDDMREALRRARMAVALAPDLPLAQNNLAFMEADVGDDERELRASRAARRALDGSGANLMVARSAAAIGTQTDANIAEEVGDFRNAAVQYKKIADAPDFEGSHWLARRMGAAVLALAHDIGDSRRLLGNGRDSTLMAQSLDSFGWQLPNFRFAQFEQFVALGDWRAARKDIETALAVPQAARRDAKPFLRAQIWPRLALAQAMADDPKAAWSTAAKMSLDCYPCLRVRGQIDATQRNWRGSATWFARAVKMAPSIPFAYFEWGQMLLAKGDRDGAIAKFSEAHAKGPHFADPLEVWGEALIAKNRSDLALAKFEDASKDAPSWGRLHLKWGEALWWSGKKDEARKQFSTTSHLDLSAAERFELGRIWHG
jgi:tetratricopeptide (TPR) repeat protein